MPLRGIGTVQWTKSTRIGEDKKEENYLKASEHAEIISTLLDNEELIDLKREENIFTDLTSPQEFVFKKEKDKTGSTIIRVKQGNSPFYPLLKTSVGILEAKQVSLLLAHKHIQTLCLEEPDRGMHPQMIERLKRVLYEEGFHKTIIVASHSPYFIDTLSVRNTYFLPKKIRGKRKPVRLWREKVTN
ncbi:uncharacterized protein LOC134277196 [Saccostrea cucullata]|uniref:uncharacterized protein LOC134277196 n=1 Tax=Saccostrea cuccullata TaxID=36930 RepID=UPI002ED1BF91